MEAINLLAETFDPHASYGRMANELYAHLTARGYHVNCLAASDDYLPNNNFVACTGGIMIAHPTRLEHLRDVVPIAAMGRWICCTGNEMTLLPIGWRDALNQFAGVSVWSNWQGEVFRENGVTAPLQVDSLGVSEAFKAPMRRTLAEGEPLTFLCIGDRGERKASHVAIHAFVQAFGDDPHYRLIIKTRAGRENDLTNPNIHMISEDMTDKQLADLYRSAHVMVFPACGEGFGFPPREFAATGGIALATNWSGLTDDIEHWGVPIDDYTFAPAYARENDPAWTVPGAEWVNVDPSALAHLMRRVDTYFEEYAAEAYRAASFVAERYRWQRWGEGLLSLYETQRTTQALSLRNEGDVA